MGFLERRKQKRLLELERSRLARRMANEDVAQLGEDLTELHHQTQTVELQGEIGRDHQRALDAYEQAKQLLRGSEDSDVLRTLRPILEEGRYHLACVLAQSDGRPVPERRPPCFFNSQHGPSHTEVDWMSPGGVERRVPACLPDADRLEQQQMPAVRTVRVGDRLVPWYAADEAFGLVEGTIDGGLVEELRTYHHERASRYGAAPPRNHDTDPMSGPF